MTPRAGGLLAAALAVVAGAVLAFDRWVDATALPPLAPPTSAMVLDRNGALLSAYTVADGRWRLPVELAAVDRGYLAQLVAFEDHRFRRHAGIDPLALTRAALQSLAAGRIVSGGSTLTMQVARLIENGPTGTAAGKLRQMRVALALERRLDKDAILTLYLTLAPYGGNLEGIRAASLAWLGKEPRRLTPAEAALLVALPQTPEARRPDRAPGVARVARDRVLARAVAAGVLAADEAAAARTERVPTVRRPFPALAPHLADRLVAARPGAGAIATTLDAGLQARLEALLAARARDLGKGISAAMIVADHRSGAVLARIGAADRLDPTRGGFVDMSRAVRSPGSTLKPLVYGLAFEAGIAHPETIVDDRPMRFGSYAPQNLDRGWLGPISARTALQASRNLPAVALLDAVGPAQLLARLRCAGDTPRLPPGGTPGLAIALGGVGLSLEDLVRLYAAIARGGQAVALFETPERRQSRRPLRPPACWTRPPPGTSPTSSPVRHRRRTAPRAGSPSRPAPATATATPGRSASTAPTSSGSGSDAPTAPRFPERSGSKRPRRRSSMPLPACRRIPRHCRSRPPRR